MLCILSAVLTFQPNALAIRIDEKAYRYPYKDPYLATTTVAILNGTEKPQTSEIKDLRLTVQENRNNIYLLEGKGLMRYRLYQQKGSAPLIFIMPGLAGSAYSGAARFLAEWLAGHGFHVLILPSPFNWNFTLAASASATPGQTREDTQDLYAVMRLVLDDIKTRYHVQVGKIGVLGFSDGALYSAFLSKMDAEKWQIGADTYLLINPPVDLLEAIKKLDDMADIGKDYSIDQRSNLEVYGFGVVTDALQKDINNPAYFADWDKRLKLSDKQMQYLIGKAMRDAVGDTVYVMDIVKDPTILKTPINSVSHGGALEEARSYSLMDYVNKFLVPKWRANGRTNLSFKALEYQNSLKGIKSVLQKKQTVFLMHNLDDILVSKEDIAFLENLFGDRATIYPYGGHMGNLWYPENKQHILEVFSPLLQN
jgi:hypothetical protein